MDTKTNWYEDSSFFVYMHYLWIPFGIWLPSFYFHFFPLAALSQPFHFHLHFCGYFSSFENSSPCPCTCREGRDYLRQPFRVILRWCLMMSEKEMIPSLPGQVMGEGPRCFPFREIQVLIIIPYSLGSAHRLPGVTLQFFGKDAAASHVRTLQPLSALPILLLFLFPWHCIQ